ncbi:hypothetical protein JS756_03585 [Streptomyces actuosus]|uniref:DUF4199 domain-containing protein n=1 Tax=Streptomyces actuosus TaxID=1885 RepID=A0ABS2VJD5_STRAS|nr:hypothetical protein [Streptomyces actuosus]MBN0043199.1 hypothetical protein [Streptomyces actuosus]
MKTSFKIHAAALTLSGFSLLVSALTLLPGPPLPYSGGPLLAIEFALLFPLFIVTIGRGMAMEAGGRKLSRAAHWPALQSLPRPLRLALVCIFASGIGLTASSVIADTSRQAGKTEVGRYYAVDLDSPTHEQVEVSKSEYDTLRKHDQRAMHAITGMLAAGAATMTLVIGHLHPSTGRYMPPSSLDPSV